VAEAATPAERAAAEEQLKEELAREVEAFEARQGPPVAAEPVEEPSPGTRPESPKEESGQPQAESEEPSTSSTATNVQRVFVAAGISEVPERVLRGTEESVLAQIIAAWIRDLSLSPDLAPDLEPIAWRWIRAYRMTLSRADARVVEALTAWLAGRAMPAGVASSEVYALRSALLATQTAAEREVGALIGGAAALRAEAAGAATFFLFTR
jgi:hypothetical protein